jgi:DNA helicase-2/ATP-dependent DNA helicase PcrA
MRRPTPEQQAILDDTARVRAVRAAPGSGKTWLIAEEIRHRLANWPQRHAGIAALSFTNVARDEIIGSVGASLDHPHFVGTIDAFVLRYIVQPFANVYDTQIKTPRLIPAAVADILSEKQKWHAGGLLIQVGPTRMDREHIFRINAVDIDGGMPVYWAKFGRSRTEVFIRGSRAKAILKMKRSVWTKSGCLSHSDVTFLADAILRSPEHSKKVIDIISHRFPLLIVDELQDTGYFLARVVHQLVARSNANALLVGDPDQAIFEFNGARPDLFKNFESIPDANARQMRQTQRCASRVCAVVDQLSHSHVKTEPCAGRSGAAVLISHQDNAEQRMAIIGMLRDLPGGTMVRIVARKGNTVSQLKGTRVSNAPKFGSVPLNHLHEAANRLRVGDTVKALATATAAAARSLFGTEAPSEEMLAERGIDAGAWKRGVIELLLNIQAEEPDEDLYQWGERAKTAMRDMLLRMNWTNAASGWTFKAPASKLKGMPRSDFVATASDARETRSCRTTTVHGAKGETHDVTLLYVPKCTKRECPSRTWWSHDAGDQEERRVTFVAASRPRHLFVLCAHESTVQRLRSAHPEFISLFEELSLTTRTGRVLSEIYSRAL